MRIILIDEQYRAARTIVLGRWRYALLSLYGLGLPLAVLAMALLLQSLGRDEPTLSELQDEMDLQNQGVARLRAQTGASMQALSLTANTMETRLARLDATGELLAGLAGLDADGFDFNAAQGGPLTPLQDSALVLNATGPAAMTSPVSLATQLEQLELRITERERQLELLRSLLDNRQQRDDAYLAGRPIRRGWISSPFGVRKDPFTKRSSWHQGVDFAGREGTDIVAVAGGVVTWAGRRGGYGIMVEINHGSGYVTRYSHNKDNQVKVGDIVDQGQVIATMGSSGRSTGPHVHYEVYKHGRPVDPSSYVQRTNR